MINSNISAGRGLVATVIALSALLGFGAPAANATSTSTATTTAAAVPFPQPGASFGWHMYLRWSKDDTKLVAEMAAGAIAAGIAYFGCGRMKEPKSIGACSVAVAAATPALARTFAAAAREDKCVEIKVSYVGPIVGWKRYSCR